jgi:hypothetical protein
MIETDGDRYFIDPGLATDGHQPSLNKMERSIRIALLAGFVAVIALEAWLLYRVWQLWA